MYHIKFRVNGEPQPFPKKDVARVGNRLIPVDKDYRTKKGPDGKIRKYDRGHKRAWMKRVALTASGYGEMIKKPEAVMIHMSFYLTRSKSNKLLQHTIKPDCDNLAYAVVNALNKVLYEDDCQLVNIDTYKEFANTNHPPGVEIMVGISDDLKERPPK